SHIDTKRQHIDDYTDDNTTEEETDIQMTVTYVNMDVMRECLSYFYEKNYTDKMRLKHYLKSFRKELSKNQMNPEILSQIFSGSSNIYINNNTNVTSSQEILMILVEFLFNFKNSEVQLEAIWILNNLCIFSHTFKFQNQFYQIHQILIKFLQNENNFSNRSEERR